MRVVIVEAGEGYTTKLGEIFCGLTGDEQGMVEQAQVAVAECGFRVMPNDEGGCCEFQTTCDGDSYIGISVYPG